ncbi:uncharacterized protein LOC116343638 [Contarinia nasturtii]|uniref:uncharacterized protein LOC116343638 n=1 Tax=Contarinia nasturtii TaxID=265458 RepID=UPI0012D3B8D8|nr:uncharacterized protein LOC116343638 [Contarinia nasturtii]
MPGPAKMPAASGGKLPPTSPKIKSGSSSFQMPTSSSSLPLKSKSGSGLRILWIPGRRKHHDKGAYKPTNYNIEHKHGDRKNETWNLGGSKSHEDILTGSSDKEDHCDPLTSRPASTPASNILPSATLGVTTVDNCSGSESEIKLEKCVIKDIHYVKYNIRDSLQSLTSAKENSAQSTNVGDGDEKRSAPDSAGRSYTKFDTDFDSIERIDDLDGQPKLSHQNGLRPKSKCTKSKEDKTVKCLYYTMMCCECTIS